MARIRTIKPQHWSDKELAKISLQAHLLWIAMWNFSDDAGVIESDPLLLRSNIFPRRTDIRTEQISQWLDQLVKARFIIPFEYQNDGYYLHRTFGAHQKIDRPQASIIPPDIIRRIIDEHSSNDRPCIVEYSSVKVEEGKGENRAPENSENDEVQNDAKDPPEGKSPPVPPPPPRQNKGPCIEAVLEFFSRAGGNDEMANAFWNKWEGLGWMNGISPIVKWAPFANNFIASWNRNEQKDQKNGAGRKQTVAGSVQAVNAAFDNLQRGLDAAVGEGGTD